MIRSSSLSDISTNSDALLQQIHERRPWILRGRSRRWMGCSLKVSQNQFVDVASVAPKRNADTPQRTVAEHPQQWIIDYSTFTAAVKLLYLSRCCIDTVSCVLVRTRPEISTFSSTEIQSGFGGLKLPNLYITSSPSEPFGHLYRIPWRISLTLWLTLPISCFYLSYRSATNNNRGIDLVVKELSV